MKKIFLPVLCLLVLGSLVNAQTVGISEVPFTPSTKAILDLSSSRAGFLPPRLPLNSATDPISGVKPAGLMVYNEGGAIGVNGFYYWDGSVWQMIPNASTVVSGSGTLNYLPKFTPNGNTIGNSQLFDDATNIGIGTNLPIAKLNVREGQESLTQADFTQGLGKAGLLITTDYTDNSYTPGLFWNTANNNALLPKAGIYLHQGSLGSKMILSTSTNFASGLDNNGLVIDDLGNIGIGALSPVESMELYRNGSNPVMLFHAAGIGSFKQGLDGGIFKIASMDNGYGGHTGSFAANDAQVISMITNGNVGIGNVAPGHKLSVGEAHADSQPVTIRGYSNSPASWKGGGAFGYGTANVIMGQLNGVAQIGGHNGDLSAWSDLAINLGGNVGFGNTAPAAKVHIGPLNDRHLYLASANNAYGWMLDTRDNGGGSVPFRITKRTNGTDTEVFTILNQNGNVGINTNAPGAKFHVHTTGTGGIGISDDGWASIRMDGADSKSLWIHYGAASTNELRFARTGDGFGGWEANVVAFDMDAPEGAIRLDGTGVLNVGNLAGAGTRMVTATASGALATQAMPGGVLPAGTAAQTLYNNGTSWVATSNLSNDGGTINLGSFTNTNVAQWPLVTWLRDMTGPLNWDEGLIKGSSTEGVWGTAGFGIHMHADRHFGFYSTGWDPLLDVDGGTGKLYIKGNTGIGNINPIHHLQVGVASGDGQSVTLRGYSNTGSWKGGAAFGYTSASVIMGELSGVAQIGGHNASLNAWSDLVLNVGGTNVGIGQASPQSTLHVMGKTNIHQSGTGGGQNRFEGLDGPTTANGRAQLVLSSSYSDLVIASSQANDNHGSTLTWATYNPANAADYRKWAINQGNWGARSQFLDFGYGTTSNPHSFINSGSVSLTLDGANRRVGIQTMSPQVQLEVTHNGAATYGVGIMMNQNAVGNSDGPKMQFRKTMTVTKDWSIGMLNGVDVGSFAISENGGIGGFGTSQFTILPGGNVGLGTTNPVGRLQIVGNHGAGVMQDGNDRPSIATTGVYPQMVIMSGNSGNVNHGGALMIGGYDAGASGNHKHWSIGTAGAGSTFLDIGYHAGTDLNPHAGIRNYNGTTMMTILNDGNVGLGSLSPTQKLDVNGTARAGEFRAISGVFRSEARANFHLDLQGDRNMVLYDGAAIWATGTTVSDIRTKRDIRPLEETLPTLMQLSAIRFKYKPEEDLGDDDHVGVIAQEILKYYPDMVFHDEKADRYIVHYDKLTTLLLKGMQEQQEQIEALKVSNQSLQTDNAELKSAVSSLKMLEAEVAKIKASVYQEAELIKK